MKPIVDALNRLSELVEDSRRLREVDNLRLGKHDRGARAELYDELLHVQCKFSHLWRLRLALAMLREPPCSFFIDAVGDQVGTEVEAMKSIIARYLRKTHSTHSPVERFRRPLKNDWQLEMQRQRLRHLSLALDDVAQVSNTCRAMLIYPTFILPTVY
jgi:hypothetical protein